MEPDIKQVLKNISTDCPRTKYASQKQLGLQWEVHHILSLINMTERDLRCP
jgi:hypothetical protein